MHSYPQHRQRLREIHQGISVDALKSSIDFHLNFSQVKEWSTATPHDKYNSVALAVRDRLVERWIRTQRKYRDEDPKRIYYLSMEYLVGRALSNYMVNLEFRDFCYQAIKELGMNLEEIEAEDIEAGLGNGGLGRLAACYLDSLATLSYPAYGYGIRYEFGIFYQKIINGYQQETADNWLRRGSPWEIPRPDYMYPIKFYGRTVHTQDEEGQPLCQWVDTRDDVMAMAYDIPIPGYHNLTVNNLRLWSARSTREFDLQSFNEGNYVESVSKKQESEIISKVLYPNDTMMAGKELRLKQEYFFVSASLQDILRRYKIRHTTFELIPEKVAIQLNDTHPALAIPELMRILVDMERRPWEEAWEITIKTFGYTNHTVLPEALEKWPVELLGRVLPRHLEIIYKINQQFLDDVRRVYPKNLPLVRKVSLVDENPPKSIRMAHLAIVGSHTVNGVAQLHSNILKEKVFPEFHLLFPHKFQNKTNGVTQRLWLKACNPELARLLDETIGEDWVTNLSLLKRLESRIEDSAFRERWREIKWRNKERLARLVFRSLNIHLNPDSMFDVQIKRIHEYKRQLLCVLHVIALYLRFKESPSPDDVPRTVVFAGKAAPGYVMAKLIIKLINSVADLVNQDRAVRERLKVIFIPNYNVNKAECIIPAADLSEQISTAGMEASGTGNMKLALNGALTIGTLDGANIEMLEEVGEDNFFIFGLKADEVAALRQTGYHPEEIYRNDPELKRVIDMIRDGYFSKNHPHLFQPIVDSLLKGGDPYMVLADFRAYIQCQEEVDRQFRQPESWTRKSILNSSRMGRFSSDRAIREYAQDIWKVQPLEIGTPPRTAEHAHI